MKRLLAIGAALALLATMAPPVAPEAVAEGDSTDDGCDLYVAQVSPDGVGGSGSGGTFATIHEAVDASEDGDVICVYPGTYAV